MKEKAIALLTVGKLLHEAAMLDVDVLENYLNNPAPDFSYEKQCREVIKFVRAVRQLGETEDNFTVS